MRTAHIPSVLATIAICGMMACGHNKEEMLAPHVGHFTVEQHLAIDWRYASHEYDIQSTYEDDFGNLFQLDTLRFLISGAHAVDDDGVVFANYSNVYLLIDASSIDQEHVLGTLTSDHLHEIRFNIGLEPAMNHADPSQALPPLNDQTMHSGSTAEGYCLLQITGRVDSNGDGAIDATDLRFSHRCIGDDLLRQSTTIVHANLPAGGVLTAWLPIDVEMLLDSIDLLNMPSSSGAGTENTLLMEQLLEAMEQEH